MLKLLARKAKQCLCCPFSKCLSSRQIKFVPEVAKKECWDYQECFAICPTSYAQAAYLLTEALAFPGQRKTAARAAKAVAKPRVIIPIMPVPMTA